MKENMALGQHESMDAEEDSHAAGFTRKLDLLESGLADVPNSLHQPADRFRWFSQAAHGRARSKLRIVILGSTFSLDLLQRQL